MGVGADAKRVNDAQHAERAHGGERTEQEEADVLIFVLGSEGAEDMSTWQFGKGFWKVAKVMMGDGVVTLVLSSIYEICSGGCEKSLKYVDVTRNSNIFIHIKH